MATRSRDKRAFTLTEVLVVVAVVIVIASFVVPAVRRAAASGRQVMCKNNLSKLGQGYYTQLARNKMIIANYTGSLASTWSGTMVPFIGNDGRLLICPESPVRHHESKPRFGQSAWYDMTWDFYNLKPAVWEGGSFADFWEGDTSVPSMWKMNDEDYAVWQSNRRAGWGNMTHNKDDMPQYNPGGDPNSYWILFEDSAGEWMSPTDGDGRDFVDFDVHVTVKGPGNYEFTFYDYGNSVARHWVIDAEDEWHEIPPECESGFGPFSWSDAPTNYGMARIQDPTVDPETRKQRVENRPGLHKVLLLDYDQLKCELGPPMPGPGDEDSYENNVGARHLGRCNYLFADGSVQDFYPDEMSPRDPDIYRTFWHPLDMELAD